MKTAYIKPVYFKGMLVSLALCYNDKIIVDEDIIEHFDAGARGKDIKEIAKELGFEQILWGNIIEVDEKCN